MKASAVRADLTVPLVPKVLALCITMLDQIWSAGDRNRIIKQLAMYYGVTL